MQRQIGESTRLVDKYIQDIFTKPIGTVHIVRDHYPDDKAHKLLFDRICRRLATEHGLHINDVNVYNQFILRGDKTSTTIWLEKNKNNVIRNARD